MQDTIIAYGIKKGVHMIEKNIHFLIQKVNFLKGLTVDCGAIFKIIQATDVTTLIDKYLSFIDLIEKKGFGKVVAVMSVDNYAMLGDEQAIFKDEFRKGDKLWIETEICGVKTFILKKGNIFEVNPFPKDKVLLLSYNEKTKSVEITDNKFAVVNITI